MLTKLLYIAGVSAQEHGGGRHASKEDAADRLASCLAACQHIKQCGLSAPGRAHLQAATFISCATTQDLCNGLSCDPCRAGLKDDFDYHIMSLTALWRVAGVTLMGPCWM